MHKGFEPSYFKRQCRCMQTQSKEKMKALITTFIVILIQFRRIDLNNLFRVEMMNNVKSLFKTMIEFDMIDDVLTVFKCMNDVYKKVPMIDGPQPIF